MKERLDVLLVKQGLAVSREEKRFGTALIPSVTMIHNITVTGIGK